MSDIEKLKQDRYQEIINYYNKMEPFKDIQDVPNIPIIDEDTYKNVIVPNLIRCGAIPKSELIVGHTYLGSCRNAKEAIWDGEQFLYKRNKFGYIFTEEINHFEDDDGYDLFVPLKDLTN